MSKKSVKTFWTPISYDIDPVECPFCEEFLDCVNIVGIDEDALGGEQIDNHEVQCYYCKKKFLITIDEI